MEEVLRCRELGTRYCICSQDALISRDEKESAADVQGVDEDQFTASLKELLRKYRPMVKKLRDEEEAENNKKNRTPSLNLQEKGPRAQDAVQFC